MNKANENNDSVVNGDAINKNLTPYFIIFVIIAITIGRIIYSFVYLKEDFHSDEIWSFGLSNSYYEPFIFQNADHTELINKDKWISSKVMKDYLTVSENHKFSYDSVYYNQVHDYHPPLYYFILHTICSFFPQKYSPWYGFSINIVTYVFSIVFLYKLSFDISKSEKLSIICCAFYGFSVGVVNTFVFVRMYSLLTMLSVIILYVHSRLYRNNMSKKFVLLLYSLTLLGCLTHHFFIPYAGMISMCFCIYYLLRKRFKELLIYSFTMISGVLSSILIFPATIDHLFSGRIEDNKLPFSWQIKMVLNCMLTELFGTAVSVVPRISYTALLIEIVCVSIILAPLVYLFRNEKWFISFIGYLKYIFRQFNDRVRKANLIVVSILFSSAGIILLTSLTVSMMMMSTTADRYIFNIFPGICVVVVIITNEVMKIFTKKETISFVISIVISGLLCVSSNVFGGYHYFFTKPENYTPIKSVIKDSDCIFVSDEFWLLTCFTKDSFNAENIYCTTAADLEKKITNDLNPVTSNNLYYFVNESSFYKEYEDGDTGGQLPDIGRSADQSDKLKKEEFEQLLEEKYSMCEYIGEDTVFERHFWIYRVV